MKPPIPPKNIGRDKSKDKDTKLNLAKEILLAMIIRTKEGFPMDTYIEDAVYMADKLMEKIYG